MKTTQRPSTKKTASNGHSARASTVGAIGDRAMETHGLRTLLQDGLKDIYWAEKALTKALPKMIKYATSPELVNSLKEHLTVTEEQVARVEEVFGTLGMKAQAKKCEAMDGLIREATEIIESTQQGLVRDAGIILAGQKVEHYEIATYGTLCAFAQILGEGEAADLLKQTLEEEKQADKRLSEIAYQSINLGAAHQDGEKHRQN